MMDHDNFKLKKENCFGREKNHLIFVGIRFFSLICLSNWKSFFVLFYIHFHFVFLNDSHRREYIYCYFVQNIYSKWWKQNEIIILKQNCFGTKEKKNVFFNVRKCELNFTKKKKWNEKKKRLFKKRKKEKKK